MVRAVFTTCGRNIFPSPKSFPTRFIPFISGPSMIFTALPYADRASCKSASSRSTVPLTRAYSSLSSRDILSRMSVCGVWTFCTDSFLRDSAASISRSVASGRRLKMTSSIRESNSWGISVYATVVAGLTMAMSIPARIAWNKKTACMASRI